MLTDGNQTYHGDHFVMYRKTESLCYAPGPNSAVGQLYFDKQINKLIERKKLNCGYQGWEVGGGGDWVKVVKRYKLPIIRQISIRDVMYNMINIINTAVCYINI